MEHVQSASHNANGLQYGYSRVYSFLRSPSCSGASRSLSRLSLRLRVPEESRLSSILPFLGHERQQRMLLFPDVL